MTINCHVIEDGREIIFLNDFIFLVFKNYVYVHVPVYVHVCTSACEGQKCQNPFGVTGGCELLTWVLGSGDPIQICALNH